MEVIMQELHKYLPDIASALILLFIFAYIVKVVKGLWDDKKGKKVNGNGNGLAESYKAIVQVQADASRAFVANFQESRKKDTELWEALSEVIKELSRAQRELVSRIDTLCTEERNKGVDLRLEVEYLRGAIAIVKEISAEKKRNIEDLLTITRDIKKLYDEIEERFNELGQKGGE